MTTTRVTADISATHERADVAVAPAYGRFSTGMERSPETSADAHIGHFSEGIQQSDDISTTERVGRFSTGMERSPEAPEARPVGSFADGYGHERTGGR